MHHVVQNGLFSEFGFKNLMNALEKQEIPYTVVEVVPSSHEIIPNITADGPIMVWGAITLGRIAAERGWKPGRFMNHNFDMRVWLEKYQSHMLNGDAIFSELGSISEFKGRRFIRPVHDSKLFSGTAMSWAEIEEWRKKILNVSDGYVSLDLTTPVMVSSVKDISLEARFFVVDGQVISGSTYRTLRQILYREVHEYPMAHPLLDFAQRMADLWEPDKAFVIDVAEVDGEPKIIELNCINSSGFYATNVNAVVMAIENLDLE